MRNHTVEIGDRNGKSFKIHISTPAFWDSYKTVMGSGRHSETLKMTGNNTFIQKIPQDALGNWKTVDKGFIRYNSGKILIATSDKLEDVTTKDIYILNLDGTWGIKLFEYEDVTGVNDDGEGFVIQPWVISIGMGKFSWSLMD